MSNKLRGLLLSIMRVIGHLLCIQTLIVYIFKFSSLCSCVCSNDDDEDDRKQHKQHCSGTGGKRPTAGKQKHGQHKQKQKGNGGGGGKFCGRWLLCVCV